MEQASISTSDPLTQCLESSLARHIRRLRAIHSEGVQYEKSSGRNAERLVQGTA